MPSEQMELALLALQEVHEGVLVRRSEGPVTPSNRSTGCSGSSNGLKGHRRCKTSWPQHVQGLRRTEAGRDQ
jgi:hypothetical protein